MDAAEQTTLDIDAPVAPVRPIRTPPRELSVRRLSRWADRQLRSIRRAHGGDPQSEAFVLAQAVKLGEEVGELHAEVLGRLKRQRRSKGTRFDDRSLRGELADVVICVAILARTTGVDLEAALEEKMAEIDRRD